MAIRDKYDRGPSPTYIDWKPAKWNRSHPNRTPRLHCNGRTDHPGPRHTKSPAALRRKARSLAGRKR